MDDLKKKEYLLDELKKTWLQVPQQRFFQLLLNIIRESEVYTDKFYIEDDQLLPMIRKFNERNEIDLKVDKELSKPKTKRGKK